MKNLFTALFLLLSVVTFGQQNKAEIHERYCRHYPEQVADPSFAYRNDWQSDFVHDYDVTFYFLDIEVSNTSIDVSGEVTIHGKVLIEPFETFAFELLADLSLENVRFNGQDQQNWVREGNNVILPVEMMTMGQTFVATITYGGTPPTGGFFSGITNDYNSQWDKEVTWTLSEPFDAKDWWPCKQVLTDKADSAWIFLTTSNTNLAGSNGLLTNVTDMGNNKVRYEWKTNYPIDYYLISFAVADYQDYSIYAKPAEMEGDSILVQNYIYDHPNYLNTYKTGIDAVIPMIELLSELYILYPFKEEKYGHCITELGGGMEHQTMTTIGGWSFNLVAHELGHMWFGDNVTCATWSDIWINEGFATYSNYLSQEKLNGWNAGQNFMVGTQNNVMSATGGSVFIPEEDVTPDDVWRIFNGRLSYDKGAAIIHLLRHEINNDTVFFDVMHTFQETFTDSTATGLDYKMVAEQVSGLDLEDFFNQWYFGEGYPKYDISWYMFENTMNMTVTQSVSSTTPLFKMTMDYKLNFEDGTDTVIRLYQNANIQNFAVEVPKQVVSMSVDPDNWTFERVNTITVIIEETNNPNYFAFGPNPANEVINIYLLNPDGRERKAQICDLSGRVLSEQSFTEASKQVDVSWLKAGAYLINISDDKQHLSKRFIK
jgi:aminopeptidase N